MTDELKPSPIVERASDAREIARPIADTVDWYVDEAGAISAVHQSEPITTEERLAVIAYVVANDVLNLARVNEELNARIAELEEQIEALHRDEYEQTNRLEQLVAEICKPFVVTNHTLKQRVTELERIIKEGYHYVDAFVEYIAFEDFDKALGSGKLDGVRAWQEEAGEVAGIE